MGIRDETDIYPAVTFPDHPRIPERVVLHCEPELSEWRCFITNNTCITPHKGKEPNWFHRLMQRLILGFRWERDK